MKENLEFIQSETLWCVADPDHAAPLHLDAVLLMTVQLDLQLERPRTVGAPLPERKNNEREKFQSREKIVLGGPLPSLLKN